MCSSTTPQSGLAMSTSSSVRILLSSRLLRWNYTLICLPVETGTLLYERNGLAHVCQTDGRCVICSVCCSMSTATAVFAPNKTQKEEFAFKLRNYAHNLNNATMGWGKRNFSTVGLLFDIK